MGVRYDLASDFSIMYQKAKLMFSMCNIKDTFKFISANGKYLLFKYIFQLCAVQFSISVLKCILG